MTALHLILDPKGIVALSRPGEMRPKIYHATINISELNFENPAEVTEAAIRLARLLLEHVPKGELG